MILHSIYHKQKAKKTIKNTLLLISLLSLYSCKHKHRTAREIYESGNIGDTADWSKPYIVNGVYDMRIYKYDSSLIVLRRYADDNPKIHCGTSFLYHNKMEGTSLTAIPNDFDLWVAHYKNCKEDGLALRYSIAACDDASQPIIPSAN